MIVSWICFLSLKRRWSKEAFHRFGSKIDSGSAMYIQPPSPVSISQKYWRLFLRKVNMAFEEMCSPKKYWIHTNYPKLSLLKKKHPLSKKLWKVRKGHPECVPTCTIGFCLFSPIEQHLTRLGFCSPATSRGGKTWRSPYLPEDPEPKVAQNFQSARYSFSTST